MTHLTSIPKRENPITFSIIVNGYNLFEPEQGIRQDDLISLYLLFYVLNI